MKGLFIKDFLTLRRKYGPVRIAMDVLLIAVLMIAFGANSAIWVSFVLVPIEAMTMCMTLTNCDEQWKWQKYAFALPVSRAQIVRARYLTAGALAGIGFAASLAVNAAAALAFSAYPPVLHLLLAAASLWLTLFALALVLPAGLSRGANAGFAAMFAVILALRVLFGAAGFSAQAAGSALAFAARHVEVALVLAICAVAAACALSYEISVRLLRRARA